MPSSEEPGKDHPQTGCQELAKGQGLELGFGISSLESGP